MRKKGRNLLDKLVHPFSSDSERVQKQKPDWIQTVDAHEAKEDEIRRVAAEALKAKEEKEIQDARRELGRKFRCHICDKPSKSPRSVSRIGSHGTYLAPADWSEPGDLRKCKCDKWCCEDHYYKGLCPKCAKKL